MRKINDIGGIVYQLISDRDSVVTSNQKVHAERYEAAIKYVANKLQ